jgi:hypothetical protein
LFFHEEISENLPSRWLNRMFPEYSVKIRKASPVEVSLRSLEINQRCLGILRL